MSNFKTLSISDIGIFNIDDIVKSRISPPLAGGDEGEGDK
jgi:hypothetical protein